jgi:replicative DNA helicase
MANDNLIRISKMKTCEWESNHDLVYRHFDTISRRNDNKDSLGVKSGFMDLDRITGGWRPGQLIFIGAVPKAGKTSAALHCAMKAEVPVLFFSLEMMPEELADRQFAVEAEVDAHSIITGHINDNDWAKVMGKMDTLMGKDISWIKKSGLSVLEIKAVAQRFKQENGLGLIIIDQLDKVSERKQGNENRTDQIGRVTRGLKEMALELEVPVLCLVQLLDKNIGQRKNKRPSSGDVRDSSYPDQDCDVMIYLWRPAIYYPDAKSWANTAELIVSRQRSGATGSAWVQWTPEFTKFRELDVNTQNYMRNVNWAKDADE